MKRFRVLAVLATFVAVWAICTPVSLAQDKPKLGSFDTKFTSRNEMATVANLKVRFGERRERNDPERDYNIEDFSFDVYVPEKDYNPKRKFGVLVWLSSDIRSEPSADYRAILEEHNLIWISPRDAMNRSDWHVYGLAIDALHNLKKDYRLDPERFYVAGVRNGGKLAARIGVGLADIFRGAVASGELDWFRRVDFPSNSSIRYSANYNPPSGPTLGFARQRSHFVFFVDPRESVDGKYRATIVNGFGEMKFRNVHEVEVVTNGVMPSTKEFLIAVSWLQGKTPVVPADMQDNSGGL